MPTLKESARVNISQLQSREVAPIPAPTMPLVGYIPPGAIEVSAFMQSSLPPVASGNDVYLRQFYRGGLPQRRFMPVNL